MVEYEFAVYECDAYDAGQAIARSQLVVLYRADSHLTYLFDGAGIESGNEFMRQASHTTLNQEGDWVSSRELMAGRRIT